MKILQLVPRLPFPADDGGKIGILGITKGYLGLGHEVYMGGFDQDGSRKAFEANLVPELAGAFVHSRGRADHYRAALLSLVLGRAFVREKYWSKAFLSDVIRIVETWSPDVIHLDHSHMGSYGLELKKRYPHIPVVLRAHNVEFTVWERLAANASGQLKRSLLRRLSQPIWRFESKLFAGVDAVLAISAVDEARIHDMAPSAHTRVMPAGYSLSRRSSIRRDATVAPRFAYVGYIDWVPNRDGVNWFLSAMWPAFLERWPDARLDVIGRNSGAPLQEARGVRHLGFVPDLDQALSEIDIALVPLRIGGGMRVKILDFLSRGMPVISTRIGAEGIDSQYQGRPVLELAESAEEFVATSQALLESDVLRNSLADTGRRVIAEHYDWSALLRGVLEWVSASKSGSIPDTSLSTRGRV